MPLTANRPNPLTLSQNPATDVAQTSLHLIRLHDHAIYLHRQAIAQFAAGDVTQAIETNETAIAIHLQQPKFHTFAGQLWAVQGDFKAAARSWQTAQQIDPKDTIVADCLSILKELKSATTL